METKAFVVKELIPVLREQADLMALSVFSESKERLSVFDARTVSFLDAYSRSIMKHPVLSRRPETAALGFWLRKSSIKKMQDEQRGWRDVPNTEIAPLGLVFHVCPANVDTIFMYSLAISLLMGNRNLLRISSRTDSAVILSLFELLRSLLAEKQFEIFTSYINAIQYGHDDEISASISMRVQLRVLWGGDATIKTFRRFETLPRTRELAFADRFSASIIGAEAYLTLGESVKKDFLKRFYNDSYTFDQLGCSSPQALVFLGDSDKTNACRNQFTQDFTRFLELELEADSASLASLKLNRAVDDVLQDKILSWGGSNLFRLAEVRPEVGLSDLHSCGGGYFYTRSVTSISELRELSAAHVQTIGWFGLSDPELNELKDLAFLGGIDRIVPIGEALQFHYVWDGFNLFEAMSRKVRRSDGGRSDGVTE